MIVAIGGFDTAFNERFAQFLLIDDGRAPGLALAPPNASALEEEMARLTAYLEDIDPSVIETIWDAWRCPAVLLPWLAWAMSVDVWEDGWSEIARRQAIADSPGYHRIKGTRRAVDMALALVAPAEAISISEWWEQAPQGRRGTATIHIEADLEAVAATLRKARPLVASAKPKSRAVSIGAGDRASGEARMGAAIFLEEIVAIEPYAFGAQAPEGVAVASWGLLVEETVTIGAA